jgi:hypothetical protein
MLLENAVKHNVGDGILFGFEEEKLGLSYGNCRM